MYLGKDHGARLVLHWPEDLAVSLAVCHIVVDQQRLVQGAGLEDFLRDRYSEGWCIAKIMVRLTVILSRLSAYNTLSAKCVLKDMARLLVTGTSALPASWLPCFRTITRGILQIYGYLVLESTRVFGRADVDQFVLSCIWILLLHALISSSPENGAKQFVIHGAESALAILATAMHGILHPHRRP